MKVFDGDLGRETSLGMPIFVWPKSAFYRQIMWSCRTDTGYACRSDRRRIRVSDHASMTRATGRFTDNVSDRHVWCLSVRQGSINPSRPRGDSLGHVSRLWHTWQSTVPRRTVITLSVLSCPTSFELRFERGFRLRIRNFEIYITPLKYPPEVELIFGPVLRRLGSTKPSNDFY